jgi:tRNA nucleotidyltransferase (CCA-adding enzyme)
MKTYLVGGAVRNKLLGLPVTERDWVVVGATPEQLLSQGYKPIGKDFPVFLHPKTHEEYALARTERKMGAGYKGFTCYAAPDVTLEQDLQRRDLTINAIAEDEEGHLIDPYGGQADLKAKILRPVSEAFSEDPVRVLRLARFAARFASLGFKLAVEAEEQVHKILEAGELNHLVPERVWQELNKALAESTPWVFFEVLAQTQTLRVIFPDWQELYQEAGLASLQKVVSLSEDTAIRLASLLQFLPVEQVKQGCIRLRLPSREKDLCILSAQYRSVFQGYESTNAEAVLDLLEKLDVFRRVERFQDLLMIWQSDVTFPEAQKQTVFLTKIHQIVNAIEIKKIIKNNKTSGNEIKNIIKLARIEVIKNSFEVYMNINSNSSAINVNVFSETLHNLSYQHPAEWQQDMMQLMNVLEKGQAAIDAGNVIPYTDSFVEAAEKRARQNIKLGKKPNPDVCP